MVNPVPGEKPAILDDPGDKNRKTYSLPDGIEIEIDTANGSMTIPF